MLAGCNREQSVWKWKGNRGKYSKFLPGTVEIEVAADWGNLVIDLDRQEYNNNHAETRRHVSYDALDFDGDALAVDDPALTTYTERDALREAIEHLTLNQQYILRAHYFEGHTFTEIAQALGVGVSSVTRAAERAKKTLKKFL